MKLNEIRRQNELISRCPSCGDSKNPNHGHLNINLVSGLFYCMRCQYKGRLSTKDYLNLLIENNLFGQIADPSIPLLPAPKNTVAEDDLLPGPGLPRISRLTRYHVYHDRHLWDAFETKYPGGSLAGIYLRTQNKVSRIHGERGLGWRGNGPLLSTPDKPLRIVEGPYDVTRDDDVCTFGLISQRTLEKYLMGQCIILAPDGDVWQKPALAKQIYNILEYSTRKGIQVMGLELIKEGKDPDEVKPEDIITVQYGELNAFKRDLSRVLFHVKISTSPEYVRMSSFPVNLDLAMVNT